MIVAHLLDLLKTSMPEQSITLQCFPSDGAMAPWLLECGQKFLVEYPKRAHGIRHGMVCFNGKWRCVAYWTKGRRLVVRQLDSAPVVSSPAPV